MKETQDKATKEATGIKPEGPGEEKKNITGETSSTKTGKKVHKQTADERRASGDYDLVNEPLKDKDGKTIEVPKRIDKQGRPWRNLWSIRFITKTIIRSLLQMNN
ncbi:hypothetical protein [Paenibacillus chitinolyticus]|uniref:hypothetical protein n=1 Tax=Paenibacillus chitinolyticus TaxID=79263 RepID=UPI0036688A62